MKLFTNKDGSVAAQSDDGKCIAEAESQLTAILTCGEMMFLRDNAPFSWCSNCDNRLLRIGATCKACNHVNRPIVPHETKGGVH